MPGHFSKMDEQYGWVDLPSDEKPVVSSSLSAADGRHGLRKPWKGMGLPPLRFW